MAPPFKLSELLSEKAFIKDRTRANTIPLSFCSWGNLYYPPHNY